MDTEKRPKFLAVPNMLHHLSIKASVNGITLLKDGRFKKRYTGSGTSCVDINGNFYKKAGDLKKLLESQKEPDKKRPGKRPSKPGEQDSPSVSPDDNQGTAQYSENPVLSTKKTLPREYRVHKVEVRQRILAMINTKHGKKELYFWTITFPKDTPDAVAYQAYNTWLTSLRQRRMLRNYIWIAERQQNGTIHFHAAIPHKMSVVHANRMMRVVLTSLSKKGTVPYSVFQCKRYNGIDIAKNRKTGRVTNFAIKKGTRALVTYLTKYITKNDAGFPHLAWHNSRGFSSLFTGVTMTIQEFKSAGFMDYILYRSVIDNQFFSFYPWREKPPDRILDHLCEINSYLQEQLN